MTEQDTAGGNQADRCPGLMLDAAAAHQVRPGQVRGLPEAGNPGIPAVHVLVTAQLAA